MSSTEDQLRSWMQSNNIWHKDLYNMLRDEDVETLADFQTLPLLDVIYIIDDAKETGFPYEQKLKKLHGGFKEKKRESTQVPMNIPSHLLNEFKTESTQNMNGETHSDMDLNIDKQTMENRDSNQSKADQTKPKKKSKKSKQKNTETEIENLENESENIAKPKKSKLKKKKSNKTKKSNEIKSEKDSKDLKIECRAKMEKYLRNNGIWQIDLFDLITDEYRIYLPSQLEQCRNDTEWVQEFIVKAKRCGMMSAQAKQLQIYCGIKKSKKKQRKNKSLMPRKKSKNGKELKKKSKSSANLTQESMKAMDSKERENIARHKMEPFMSKNGFWQKDLFLVLLEYEVFVPSDLYGLTKAEKKSIVKKAKQRGCMGQKMKNFKAYLA